VVGGAKGRLKKMMIDIPDELWAAYDSASDERIWNAHGEIGERYIRASLHEQQIQEWQEHHKAETDRLYERIAELEAALERVNSQIAKAWNDIGSPACDAAPIPWMARTIKNWSIAQKKSDAALVAATDRGNWKRKSSHTTKRRRGGFAGTRC